MLSSVPDSMGVSLGSSVMKSASKLLKSLFPRYSKEDSEWRPGRRELRALRGERRGEERRGGRRERRKRREGEERGEGRAYHLWFERWWDLSLLQLLPVNGPKEGMNLYLSLSNPRLTS